MINIWRERERERERERLSISELQLHELLLLILEGKKSLMQEDNSAEFVFVFGQATVIE